MKSRKVNVCPKWVHFLLSTYFLHTCFHLANGNNDTDSLPNFGINSDDSVKTLVVVYDSGSIDGHLQSDLAKSAFVAMKYMEGKIFKPLFIDLSAVNTTVSRKESLEICSIKLVSNGIRVIVSLLGGHELEEFVNVYGELVNGSESQEKLYIYTPRSFSSLWKPPHSVTIKSLQMSEEARAVALLNRVNKVGVRTLIPVLDGESAEEYEQLKSYYKIGSEKKLKVKFTKPILLSNAAHGDHLKTILEEHAGFNENRLKVHVHEENPFTAKINTKLRPGILLLARNASTLAMKIAAEKKHLLLNWFSPNILEFEEWAYRQSLEEPSSTQDINRMADFDTVPKTAGQLGNSYAGIAPNNSFFGLYTVNFVGSKGWDNPSRRQMLREFAASAVDASPKILLAVLTYDAVALAIDEMNNGLKLPTTGLSGVIDFNKSGFRGSGTYLGISLVPKSIIANATLLQPSIWILEDLITLKSKEGQTPQISDYDVAMSTILTKSELLRVAHSTTKQAQCSEHLMKVVVHDPFTQMPYNYFFTPENLPETIVLPNHQGFGITFTCTHVPVWNSTKHDNSKQLEKNGHLSTLSLACTPGIRMSHPVNCFRSHVTTRHKRDTADPANPVPSVQYQYSFNNDPWLNKDDYYYQQSIGNRDYQAEGGPGGAGDAAAAAPPPPPPPPPVSKLPELRQILKAAKPFVGSCIGSTTGCAMCVLVLGRLPLGTAPPACTGPCFVGTFGSCGSLLGRVFSETTVICTELFKQGLLDVETFMADAEFGKYMHDASPYTMQGYTLLATPLVELMKSSKLLTQTVATFAIPWARHMQYMLGRSNETNLIGSTVHLIGYPLCNLTGRLYFAFNSFKFYYLPNLILLLSALVPYLLTCILVLILSANLRPASSTHSLSLYQRCLNLIAVTSRSKQDLCQKGKSYFKAIGSKT